MMFHVSMTLGSDDVGHFNLLIKLKKLFLFHLMYEKIVFEVGRGD